MTDSVDHLFLADRPAHRCHARRTDRRRQHADVIEVPLDEAVEWVLSGRVVDAKSVVGLLLAERRLRR